ncbi:Pentatricopeptide repeat-containing protein [Dichanthelium oligosanthes]|uniref:Pentatricopeptide repeat-containing protein n=1 Tax=Dichanthelium oligosanthes TaxID=888268 RepID=A0A1E5UJU6_9POAL|nr:Pentatricopeptide repeat-containing protein [Dichanthelium oligosanthes]
MGEPPRPPPALTSPAATSWPELLAPFDLSRLRATLSSHPLTPRRLARLLALPLSPATSLLLLDWYASSHPALSLSSLPLRPILAAADPDRALALLDSLPPDRLPPLRESLLMQLLRSLPPGRALHLLDQMPRRFGVTPSFRSYNVVLSTLARADCHADALGLYRRMLKDGVPPTTFTFGVAARALCRLGRADEALALLRGMARHGCVPDAVLYQTVIHSLCDQGGVAEAATLLDDMFLMGCPTDVNTFDDVVRGLCGLGRVRDAARLVDRMMMKGCAPSMLTYGFLLQGLCRARQLDEALAMLGRVPEVNAVLFNTVIGGCLAEGKLAKATELCLVRWRRRAVLQMS